MTCFVRKECLQFSLSKSKRGRRTSTTETLGVFLYICTLTKSWPAGNKSSHCLIAAKSRELPRTAAEQALPLNLALPFWPPLSQSNIDFYTIFWCLKITEKVSFNISSEASYVYILSGQKLIKQAKNGPFWRVFANLKLAVKQCYQTGQC